MTLYFFITFRVMSHFMKGGKTMVKNVNQLSIEDRLNYVLSGVDFAYFVASKDAIHYNLYRNDRNSITDENTQLSMRILSLLDRLGYDMDELGTYLYKELIQKIIARIKNVNTFEEIQECKKYLLDLKNEYSDIYHSLAREELDIGVKSFHEYIKRAHEKIDYSLSDKKLLSEIYSRCGYNMNYGEQAFVLASYILGKLKVNKNNESNDYPKIRSLSSK